MTAFSIVIAAHEEESILGQLLQRLVSTADTSEIELIVIANGCHDRTAEIARATAPQAKVIELSVASKSAALNAGDRAAVTYPRFYIDADSDVDMGVLRVLSAYLEVGDVLAVAPTVAHDLTGDGVGALVRSYYRVWIRLPAAGHGISGTGVIGLSLEARARFGEWPDLLGDDAYCDRLFAPTEKLRVATRPLRLGVPFTARALVRRKARVRNGNLQVRAAGHGTASGGNLRGLPKVVKASPRLILDMPAYVSLTVASRILAGLDRLRGLDRQWRRDDVRPGQGAP